MRKEGDSIRRRVAARAALGALLAVSLAGVVAPMQAAPVPWLAIGSTAGTESPGLEAFGRLPLIFEANRGQADAAARLVARADGYTLFLTDDEAVVVAPGREAEAAPAATVRMRLLGSGPATPTGGQPLASVSHYLRGSDPSGWLTEVPHYARVEYAGVYPGIDLVFHGGETLEYDFIVRPGADPAAIRMSFAGAGKPRLDRQGNLVLRLGDEELVHQAPYVYQPAQGVRQRVEGHYAIDDEGIVGFELASYDTRRELVIDPPVKIAQSTYLGGSGSDSGLGIAVDGAGNAYLTGDTTSVDFPLANPFQGANAGGTDAFVSKLSADGKSLVYSTYLGGSGIDRADALAIDGAGNVYLAGETTSPNFPVAAAFQPAIGGLTDAFVTKLDASGTALVFSTYLGGSGIDRGRGIAIDGAGAVYVTGQTVSVDFPTASPLQPAPGGNGDAFVTKLDAAGAALDYSTYLGGSLSDQAFDIAVDGFGSAYLTGETFSLDFPTSNPFQPVNAGAGDAFVSRLDPLGATLDYSTYLGGTDRDQGFGIAVANLQAHVTGETDSLDFPTVAAIQPAFGGGQGDAFVTKLGAVGGSVDYSTYLGGLERDAGNDITLDGSGNAYVAGESLSTDFPTVGGGPLQSNKGGFDAFVTKLDPGGVIFVYSVLVGGNLGDTGDGIAVDAGGNAFLTGSTVSTKFPVRDGAFQRKYGGAGDAFVIKLTPGK